MIEYYVFYNFARKSLPPSMNFLLKKISIQNCFCAEQFYMFADFYLQHIFGQNKSRILKRKYFTFS